MVRLAIFASGTGSNFEAIVHAEKNGGMPFTCALLVCDQPQAAVLVKADKAGVPSVVFEPKAFDDKAAFEQAIRAALEEHNIEFIALAGYMRLIGPTLLNSYEGKIVNIHPSLLPAFPGLNAVGQALQAGVKVTGVTIHYVDSGMDTGEIIAQQAVPVSDNDTEESLRKKIQAVEHTLYPETLANLLQSCEK